MMMWLSAYVAMVLGLYLFHSAWLAFLLYHGSIFFFLRKHVSEWKLLIKGWNWKVGVGAIIFGVLGGVVLYVLAPLAGVTKEMISPVLERLGLTGVWWIIFVFYHFLVNPWFEEFFWRKHYGSPAKRLFWSDFVFAGYHVLVLVLFLDWLWIVLAYCLLVLAGWFWRQLARKYDGLLLPVLSHMAADASIMFVVYLLSL